mmetsp:Transcript_51393/g.85385  ORF Transcript_51393/g.85385 Transcript_51393/m.85385 type:complete len:213 (+) Transcript_51393:171-809(+)
MTHVVQRRNSICPPTIIDWKLRNWPFGKIPVLRALNVFHIDLNNDLSESQQNASYPVYLSFKMILVSLVLNFMHVCTLFFIAGGVLRLLFSLLNASVVGVSISYIYHQGYKAIAHDSAQGTLNHLSWLLAFEVPYCLIASIASISFFNGWSSLPSRHYVSLSITVVADVLVVIESLLWTVDGVLVVRGAWAVYTFRKTLSVGFANLDAVYHL